MGHCRHTVTGGHHRGPFMTSISVFLMTDGDTMGHTAGVPVTPGE